MDKQKFIVPESFTIELKEHIKAAKYTPDELKAFKTGLEMSFESLQHITQHHRTITDALHEEFFKRNRRMNYLFIVWGVIVAAQLYQLLCDLFKTGLPS